MRILTFCGQKGGTGKTTAAVSVACQLRHVGASVLVVDADPQNSARTWVGLGARNGCQVPSVVSMGADMHQPGQLAAVGAPYDVVVIDCPSRIDDSSGATLRSALMATGHHGGTAVLPCGPGAMDVWALSSTLDVVRSAQTLFAPGKLGCAILITRKSPSRTVLGQSARDVLTESGAAVLRAELCHRIAYQEAPGSGQGVAQYQPRSQAAAEVVTLAAELMRE